MKIRSQSNRGNKLYIIDNMNYKIKKAFDELDINYYVQKKNNQEVYIIQKGEFIGAFEINKINEKYRVIQILTPMDSNFEFEEYKEIVENMFQEEKHFVKIEQYNGMCGLLNNLVVVIEYDKFEAASIVENFIEEVSLIELIWNNLN